MGGKYYCRMLYHEWHWEFDSIKALKVFYNKKNEEEHGFYEPPEFFTFKNGEKVNIKDLIVNDNA